VRENPYSLYLSPSPLFPPPLEGEGEGEGENKLFITQLTH